MMRSALLSPVLLLAACGGPRAPWTSPPDLPLDLRLALTPGAAVELLQPVTLTLDLWSAGSQEVEFEPTVPPAFVVRSLRREPEQPLFQGRWRRTVLVVAPVAGPGEFELPPFAARLADGSAAATTPPRTIAVRSALGDAAAGLEAPGEPFATPSGHWWLFGGATAAVALAALAWLVWRHRVLPEQPGTVPLPPHIAALRELQRWHAAPRTTPAQVDAFYVGVSAALRRYLEDRFGLRAPERTTDEFLRELDAGDALARRHRAELARFLRQADLVKFAAVRPDEGDHLATWALAESFVQATRPDREPEEVPA